MTTEHVSVPQDGSRPGSPSWIRNTTFTAGQTEHGYDAGEIDRLRESMAVAVESWKPVGPVIAAAQLAPGPSGHGVDAQAVNQWLGSVIALMREEPLAPPGAPMPPQPVAPDAPVETAESREIAAMAAAVRPSSAPVASSTPAVGGQDFAQRINDARFTPLRMRHGYGMTEVDDFLDELADAVTRGAPIATMVQEKSFPTYKVRECYVIEDVDEFLVGLVRDYEGALITRPSA